MCILRTCSIYNVCILCVCIYIYIHTQKPWANTFLYRPHTWLISNQYRYICIYIYVYIYMYIYICICIYIYTYIYIYICKSYPKQVATSISLFLLTNAILFIHICIQTIHFYSGIHSKLILLCALCLQKHSKTNSLSCYMTVMLLPD